MAELLHPPVDASKVIRKASTENNWDFNKEAAKLYRRAEIIMDRFYHGVATPQFPGKLPTPLLAVEPMRVGTLAAYNLVPDAYGLPFRLTFNEKYFGEGQIWQWGEWSQCETLVHELGHHWQQLRGKDPYKPGKVSHGKEFTDKMAELGIHSRLGKGSHYAVADQDSPFGQLMRDWGISRPDDVPTDDGKKNWWVLGGGEIQGHSSLRMYACAMCGLKVRVGIKDDPQLLHRADGGEFLLAFEQNDGVRLR
jgi:hypothetical protein